MASGWRYSKRSKYGKVSQDPEDFYCLDVKKSTAENAYDIYTALCCRETRDTKRLFLLNSLATLCLQQYEKQQKLAQRHLSQQQQQQQQQQSQQDGATHQTKTSSTSTATTTTSTTAAAATNASTNKANSTSSNYNLGFTTEELFYCLSALLTHSFTQVRAAALRTIRYVMTTSKDIKIFNSLQLHHLVCRSLDIMLKNDDERVQALKLIRKMLVISPGDVSPVLLRCLVSLADTGMEENDNMLRACLAALCEFAVLNPTLLIVCGGVTSITRNVLECHNPRIAESLCGVLLYLLEWPHTRNISGVRLDCLAAPYCDFTYRLGVMSKNKDSRELRYTSCRLALLSVLRSWTGTIEFCDPSKPSGLKAIVDALYLNQIEIRKAILDLLYELLGLPQPAWTEDYAVALQAVDPSDFQDAWMLNNGFVAMEGRFILPSLASHAPNVCEQHLALLLYCFLETGLLNALVEVIVSEDTHLSVRSTVLIGKLLHLMHTHLPPDICNTSPALPTLISHAIQGNPHATAAITALQSYQKMLRNRPAACSLFLDSIIQSGALVHTRLFRREISSQDPAPWQANETIAASATLPAGTTLSNMGTLDRQRLDSVSSSENESASHSSSSRRSSFRLKRKLLPFLENMRVNRLIKDSNVLAVPDDNLWDWEIVRTMLRSNLLRKMDDPTAKFLKRLVFYFKPSSNRFSHQDLVQGEMMPAYVSAGLDLIDWLVACDEFESIRIITDYFTDISEHLLAVTTSNRAHDCLFSPQHMNNTMCQQYFLYIGRMCKTRKGITILNNAGIFQQLMNVICKTEHVCYVKLIVSGLDYGLESPARTVLEYAMTRSKARSGRLYTTQFLVVLLRAKITNFEVWGIPLIIQQTRDTDRAVVLAAMDVLEEACHEKYYLEEIIQLWPNLKPLGDVGRLLMSRYYSLPRGVNNSKAKVKEDIEYWRDGYNKRYVLLVEADTHSSLTLHVRNEDGSYSRRNCNTRPITIPPNIPPHLYGQMVQTTNGVSALRKFGDLSALVETISRGKCGDDAECLELKAAIWAIGHASTHSNGIDYFVENSPRVYEKLIILASKCEVYSIRATCFSALGLIGGTKQGANILFKLNWLSVRHDRNVVWPVHQPEDWMLGNHTPVRHHYGDMPPYNYPGIEDQIDGSYDTGSYWNLLLSSSSTTKEGGEASAGSEVQEINTTFESGKTLAEETSKLAVNASKSRTLPEGTYLRHNKHQRSLSESKTTDVISIIGGTNILAATTNLHPLQQQQQQHRIRYNSCTDSNTSGVSSCESVQGRSTGIMGVGGVTVSELQPFPLSPIPSMSNLLDLQPQQAQLLRQTNFVRKGSSHSFSPMDMRGYAQLRSLRRHCRPVLSESAAELYDYLGPDELAVIHSFRPRKSSFGESLRRGKVRSLDRQSSLRMLANLDTEEMQVPIPSLQAPKFLSENDSEGPCYAGICLPKNLLELFPNRNIQRTYVLRDIQDQDLVMDLNLYNNKQQYLNDSLNNDGSGGAGVGGDESSVISSLSDVSSASKRTKWLGSKHGRNSCLHCSRARRNRLTLSHKNDTEPSASAGASASGGGMNPLTSACDFYSNASAALAVAGIQSSAAFARKVVLAPKPQPQQSNTQSSSTVQLSDISFNSPESILSEESNMPDRVTASILYNVQRLANPVSAKQSKTALLELKQKAPNAFQDICLYSEVCKTIGRNSYRMSARRFLQELFLDLNFETFYTEPSEVLNKKEKNFPPVELSNDPQYNHAENVDRKFSYKSGSKNNPSNSMNSAQGQEGFLNNPPGSSVGGGGGGSGQQMASSSFTSAHKPHMKTHQMLASVYETSCENLLSEQSPRLTIYNPTGPDNASNRQSLVNQKAKTSTEAPPPADPPPTLYQTELRINTSSDEDDETNIGDNQTKERDSKKRTRPATINLDEVDSITVSSTQQRRHQTQSQIIEPTSLTATGTGTGTSTTVISISATSTPLPPPSLTSNSNSSNSVNTSITPTSFISNCSSNSNASSACTIKRQPFNSSNSNISHNNDNNNQISNVKSENKNNNNNNVNLNANLSSKNSKVHETQSTTTTTTSPLSSPSTATATGSSSVRKKPIENENKKYTRGRFYTLELDLSCTKNKFPIRDRGGGGTGGGGGSIDGGNATSPTSSSATIYRQSSLGSQLNPNYRTSFPGSVRSLSIQESSSIINTDSVTFATTTTTTTITTATLPSNTITITTESITTSTTALNPAERYMPLYLSVFTTAGPSSSSISPSSSSSANPSSVTTDTLTITKSLAASSAKPIGSLFCEKRLQSAKSEALLTNLPSYPITSSTPVAFNPTKANLHTMTIPAVTTTTPASLSSTSTSSSIFVTTTTTSSTVASNK